MARFRLSGPKTAYSSAGLANKKAKKWLLLLQQITHHFPRNYLDTRARYVGWRPRLARSGVCLRRLADFSWWKPRGLRDGCNPEGPRVAVEVITPELMCRTLHFSTGSGQCARTYMVEGKLFLTPFSLLMPLLWLSYATLALRLARAVAGNLFVRAVIGRNAIGRQNLTRRG